MASIAKDVRCISLEQKVAIIEEVEKTAKSQSKICEELGIARGSLYTVLKDKGKMASCKDTDKAFPLRIEERYLRPDTDDVERALYPWFKDARVKYVTSTLSGPILVEKVKDFAERLGVTGFTGSTEWLGRFKSRHGVVMKTMCGESAAVCQQTTETWKDVHRTMLGEFSPDDIYNADETGLFFKYLPDRTLALKEKKGTGGKVSEERITLLVAVNMSSTEKLPLLIIGKFQNNMKILPTEYKKNSKAWMARSIFEDWVRKLNRKHLLKGRSIALVIDNCPEHPAIEGLKAISLVFFPPNTTSVLQALQQCDQGIIQTLKMHSGKRVLKKVIAAKETL